MRVPFSFLLLTLATILSAECACADSDFNELLSRFQNVNKTLPELSCNLHQEAPKDFCDSPYDFICKNLTGVKSRVQKGHLALDRSAKKLLLNRIASGNLEMSWGKLPLDPTLASINEESLTKILQDEKDKRSIMLNYNYTLAANDIVQNDADLQKDLQSILDKIKKGMSRFVEKNKNFQACKNGALSRLKNVKFFDLRHAPEDYKDQCGGSTLVAQAVAYSAEDGIVVCPGAVMSGFSDKNYDYLVPIFAHEIGHLLAGSLDRCYPNNCISKISGAGYMLDENRAEWLAAKSLPDILDDQGKPSRERLRNVIVHYGQNLCLTPNTSSGQIDSHPNQEARLNVFYGKDQRTREILNCSGPIELTEDCN